MDLALSSFFKDLEYVRRERSEAQHPARCEADLPVRQVQLNQIARLHSVVKSRALDGREPEVNRIPEEDARERVREDCGDAEGFQGDGSLLSARATPKVGSRDDHVPRPDLLRPRRVDAFERVLREHLRIRGPKVLVGNDVIRGDVVLEGPHAALESRLHYS